MASVKVLQGNPEKRGLSAREREYLQQLIPLYQKKIQGLDLARLDSKRGIDLIQDRDRIASLQYSLGMISESVATRAESVRIIDSKVNALEEDMFKKAGVEKQHEKTAKELHDSISAGGNRAIASAASEFSWHRLEELQKSIEEEREDMDSRCDEVITYRVISATMMLLIGDYERAFETAFNTMAKYNDASIFGPAEAFMIGLVANSEDVAAFLASEKRVPEALKLLEISLKSAEESVSIVGKLADNIPDIVSLEAELEKHVAMILMRLGREGEAYSYIKTAADKHAKKSNDDIAISLLDFGIALDSSSFETDKLTGFKSIGRD